MYIHIDRYVYIYKRNQEKSIFEKRLHTCIYMYIYIVYIYIYTLYICNVYICIYVFIYINIKWIMTNF